MFWIRPVSNGELKGLGNFLYYDFRNLVFFKWLSKRASCDLNGAKTVIFVEKLQKLPIFSLTICTAVQTLSDPFSFATASA